MTRALAIDALGNVEADIVERICGIISRVVYEHVAIEPAARAILETINSAPGIPGAGVCQSSNMVERVARLRRFIEMRKRIASPSAADEQSLIADLEAIIAEASHHAELVEALEKCRAELAKGRPIYSDSGTLLRQAIEAEGRKWFCSGSDCEPYDHGRDEGLKLALQAFDEERDRQLATQLNIAVVDKCADAALIKARTGVTLNG